MYGSYLALNGSCMSCPSNCQNCSFAGECDNCSSGFFLNSSRACLGCASSCGGCLSSSVCVNCTGSTYLDTSDGVCNGCPSGCSGCTDSNTCTSCNSGYDLENNVCTQTNNNTSSGIQWWGIGRHENARV